MKIKVSDYIANFLRTQGAEYIFEVAGGMITHILDSCYRLGNMNIVSVHHEQAAAFAADAIGRCTGKPGIAMATSGPGATNLLTGIASCYFDSSPGLFITGQVNTHEQKGERNIRQLGFQETDILAMAAPVLKRAYKVEHAHEIPQVLEEAYAYAINGRPGPVLIDIAMNIQSAMIDHQPITTIRKSTDPTHALLAEQIHALAKQIQQSKRPLILVGRGVAAAQASNEFIQFAELTNIPVVCSLLGLEVIPHDHPLKVGFIGSYGNRWANQTLGASDFLLVIGSRLDIRQTGADVAGFRGNKVIVHIDCDESEINNRVKDCVAILADAKEFLLAANSLLMNYTFQEPSTWQQEIASLKARWPDTEELKNFSGINPNVFMHGLSQCSKDAKGYVVDVGNHQMWAAQSVELTSQQFFMTSGGMGAMGFALPAAMGASLAHGKKPVVVIAGDGAFQFNIQELQTVIRNKIPLKIIIINNQCLGMIRQFQDSYFAGRYQSTYWGYSAPNFANIAEAYGIKAHTIHHGTEIADSMTWLWENPDEACLLEVMISPKMNVYPKIAFGKPITEMEPFAKPVEMEST